MSAGIERLLIAGVIVGGAGAGIAVKTDVLQPRDPYDLSGFPTESKKMRLAELTPILSNHSGKLEGPAVREKPQIDGRLLSEQDLLKVGVNAHQKLRGFRIFGGSYPSSDTRGRFFTQGERTYGLWFAIVNGEDKVVGYVAENFVTYLPPKNPK